MKHPRRLALPAALAATAALTAACGSASTGGTASSTRNDQSSMSAAAHGSAGSMPGMTGMAGSADTGTSAAAGGYTLKLAASTAKPGTSTTVAFTITGPDGMPVTEYLSEQTKKLHLYVIRTDLTGFQHLHPTLAKDGSWSIRTTFAEPGTYRVVADFTPRAAGVTHILGAPLTVDGSWKPQPTPGMAASTTVDGFTVNATATLTAGAASPLSIRITRGGKPVTDLQPYLGVWAHLSAFRAGNLAFAHLHPTQEPMSGMTMDSPDPLRFNAELPAAGTYRLYVQFQTDGVLHTAALTLPAR